MKVVSRFEANLLRVLHFFLKQAPKQQALPLVLHRSVAPPCLSRAAVDLVKDSLAKGSTLLLARAGGWRRERFVRGDDVAEGRLWERTPPAELGLSFSRHALDFLVWITANDPADEKSAWPPPATEFTIGDWLLFFYAYEALRDTLAVVALRNHAAFAGNALCRLAYVEDFDPRQVTVRPDFAPWLTGAGASVLEALQPELAERWLCVESSKGLIFDWEALRSLGQGQRLVLDAFLQAVEGAGRLDLALFLLQTTARLLTPGARSHMWINEQVRGAAPRMEDRIETQRAALAVVGQVERFRGWERRARGVGYFDEGYQAAQLIKSAWERWVGDDLHARAQAMIRELDPLRVQTEGQS
ncbi:MAG: hypothetical protein K2R98_17670 [Gemmataceae bacterium]|nr:hypothetical protein [Gemmataceae bacterium]